MYGYEWTGQNGIYRLSVNSKIEKEIRPVFKEELDYFGFNEHWTYPDTDAPLLWAEGIRRYSHSDFRIQSVCGNARTSKDSRRSGRNRAHGYLPSEVSADRRPSG